MSAKYPEWYELPKERWQETSIQSVQEWNYHSGWMATGETRRERSWRDSQRQKLYDAENMAIVRYSRDKIKTFSSLNAIDKYVRALLESKWIVRRFGKQPLPKIVSTSNRCAYSCIATRRLNFPEWSRNEVVILHEVSHWVHLYGYGTAHGRFFARTFLELTGYMIGAKFRTLLKQAYQQHGVKSTPYPAYSEETLEKKRQLGKQLAERKTK